MNPSWGDRLPRSRRWVVLGLALLLSSLTSDVFLFSAWTLAADPALATDLSLEISADPGEAITPHLPPAVQADHDLVTALYQRTKAESAVGSPTFSGYFSDLGARLGEAVIDWLATIVPGVESFLGWLQLFGGGWLILALLLLFLLLLAWRVVQKQKGKRLVEAAGPQPLPSRETSTEVAEALALQVEERLCQGEIGLALEALWWWMARRLTQVETNPSWTSRELVLAAHREDLLPEVRWLDRMIYGALEPAVEEVRELWNRLEAALP